MFVFAVVWACCCDVGRIREMLHRELNFKLSDDNEEKQDDVGCVANVREKHPHEVQLRAVRIPHEDAEGNDRRDAKQHHQETHNGRQPPHGLLYLRQPLGGTAPAVAHLSVSVKSRRHGVSGPSVGGGCPCVILQRFSVQRITKKTHTHTHTHITQKKSVARLRVGILQRIADKRRAWQKKCVKIHL